MQEDAVPVIPAGVLILGGRLFGARPLGSQFLGGLVDLPASMVSLQRDVALYWACEMRDRDLLLEWTRQEWWGFPEERLHAELAEVEHQPIGIDVWYADRPWFSKHLERAKKQTGDDLAALQRVVDQVTSRPPFLSVEFKIAREDNDFAGIVQTALRALAEQIQSWRSFSRKGGICLSGNGPKPGLVP